jgi:hypothetical protein
MWAEVNALSTVNAFDGLFILVQGYCANQTCLLAVAAAGAAILMKDHTAVWPLLHGARGARFGTGRILAAAADHHAKITLDSALCLYLDGAVLQGDRARARAAAGEHAAQTAYAALGMGHLESAAPFRLCWLGRLFWSGLKDWLCLCFFYLFGSLDLRHIMTTLVKNRFITNIQIQTIKTAGSWILEKKEEMKNSEATTPPSRTCSPASS